MGRRQVCVDTSPATRHHFQQRLFLFFLLTSPSSSFPNSYLTTPQPHRMPTTKKGSLRVQKPFPILRLPAEIRNQIWRYVVVKDGEVVYRDHKRQDQTPESRLRSGNLIKSHQEDDERRRSSQLAIASTCRQIYLEVTPIYYGENVFHPGDFQDPMLHLRALKAFKQAIGPKNASTITEICVYESWVFLEGHLSRLPGLKRLHVKKARNVEWDSKLPQVERYKGVPSWVRMRPSLAGMLKSLVIVYDGVIWGPEDRKKFHIYHN